MVLASLAAAALGAVSLPVVSWFFLPAIVDALALILLWSQFLVVGSGLGFSFFVNREFYELAEHSRIPFLSTLLAAQLVTLGVVVLVLWFIPHRPSHLLLVVLLSAFVLVNDLTVQYTRLVQWPKAFLFLKVAPRIVWLLCVVVLGLHVHGQEHGFSSTMILSWLLLSMLLGQFFCTVAMIPKIASIPGAESAITIDRATRVLWLTTAFKFSLPLLLAALLYFFIRSGSVFILESAHGVAAVAIVSVTFSLAAVSSVVGQLFNLLWQPSFYRRLAAGREQRLLRLVLLWGSLSLVLWTLVLMLFARAVPVLLPEFYGVAQPLLPMAGVAMLFCPLQRVSAIGIEVKRRTYLSFIAMFVALLVSLSVAYWYIPRFGAVAAVLAITLGMWVFWMGKTVMALMVWEEAPRLHVVAMLFAGTLCYGYTVLHGVV